jgi:hypothetical protein
MTAVYWYCALGIIGAVLTVFILIKKKNYYELLTFFLFAMMVAFIGEMIVLLFLNGYAYYPGVFKDYYAENLFGHIIPNATLWPATALLVAAYSLRYRGIVLITVIYTLLDILYVRLGIYQHNWWRTWMTSAAIFSYCVFMKAWYAQLKNKRRTFLRFITLWFALLIIMKLPVTALLLTGMQHAYVGWFENTYRDSGVFSVFYNAAVSLGCAFFICVLKKWYWKLVPFLLYFTGDAVLTGLGLLFFSGGWNIYYFMLTRPLCLILFIALENKYPYKLQNKYPEKNSFGPPVV